MPTFTDRYFQFSLDIPDHWRFLPPAWSPVEQWKRAAGPEDLFAFANKPFCCAQAHHDSDRHAYPTLQVTARPSAIPDNEQAGDILDRQLAVMRGQCPDFTLEFASHEAIVAGYRATLVRGNFTLFTQPRDEIVEIGVRSRSYLVFTPGLAFTLGLSSSDDPAFYDEVDFVGIIRSVRVGA